MVLTFSSASLDTLQGLSYIAQIFAGFSIVFLAFQVLLSVRDIKTRSKREAGALALQQAEFFCEKIIPQFGEISDIFEKKGRKLVRYPLSRFTRQEYISERKRANYFPQIFELIGGDDELLTKVVSLENRLESYALSFISKMADGEIAFMATGDAFLGIIEYMSVFICIGREDEESNRSSRSVVQLYSLWSDKKKREDMGLQVRKMKEELAKVGSKVMKPVGTD